MNGLFHGLPNYQIQRLQRVHNAAAQLVFKTARVFRQCHISTHNHLPVQVRSAG